MRMHAIQYFARKLSDRPPPPPELRHLKYGQAQHGNLDNTYIYVM